MTTITKHSNLFTRAITLEEALKRNAEAQKTTYIIASEKPVEFIKAIKEVTK